MTQTDWSRLALVSGSFVDQELRQSHGDLLFTAPIAGSDSFFYVLFEHQSSPDPLLSFQMLRYKTRTWERWLRQHPEARKLPAIVPFVLYNGKARWKEARFFTDLIDLETALKDALLESLPRFQFLLDDLSQEEDDALRSGSLDALVRITLLSLKNARHRVDFASILLSSAALLREVDQAPTGHEALNAIASYILEVSEVLRTETLGQVLARTIGKEAGAQVMTTAGEQIREQGRQEGVLLGLQQALLKMLRLRFGDVSERVEQRILAATQAEIDQWIGQSLHGDAG